ncbi:MAG: type II and III secretion system protein, partial [Halanaerobiales bacterium]
MKAYNSNKRLKIMLLVAVMIISLSIVANASSDLINMNFRDADVRDVFRTIAELSDTNLVTDGSVGGNITIRLNNVSFEDALDLITSTHNLAYKWYENTVVVATPERIDSIYAEMNIKNVKLNHADLTETRELLDSVFTELDIVSDHRNRSLVLKGKNEDIETAEL